VRGYFRALALGACLGAGCQGAITGGGVGIGGGSGVGGSAPPGTSTAPTANPNGKAPAGATVGPNAIRRLSRQELTNTLNDLFPALPVGFSASLDLPADNDIALAFALPGTVSDLEVKRFMDLAEGTIAALGTKQPGNQLSCVGMDETACARGFVSTFAKRAFRRPADASEVDDLMALYAKLRTDPDMSYGLQDALCVVVEAILQSPGFLYRWERGLAAPQLDGGLVKFDSYEMASRLSYFLWKSMPDATLMAAADANHLTTPDQVSAQAQRMLADPRADQALADFVTQWLELGPLSTSLKDATAYPTFTPDLLASMRAETVAFSRDVLRGATPTFANLITAKYTIVDQKLAAYYGVTPDASGRVDLSGTGRLGLLTQGSLMAVKGNSYRTSPVRRGKFVLNRLLCSIIPPPPPNAVPDLQSPDPTKTMRQQMAAHRNNVACAACHDVLDPIGYAFEHFDGAGNYRSQEQGGAVDASGTIALDGATVSFNDVSGLAAALAASPEAQGCFTLQWLRYSLGRFEQAADLAATQHLRSFYGQSGFNTRDLIVEITRSLPFSHRAIAAGEGLTP
jgi:hypothetical protein